MAWSGALRRQLGIAVELHNRTAKIESDPHRTRSSEGSVLSLWNYTGFGFPRLEPI